MSKPSRPPDAAWLKAYLDVEEQTPATGAAGIYAQTARKLFGRMFHYKGILAAGTAAVLLATAGTIAEPRIFAYAIDEAILPKDWNLVQKLALLFLCVEVLRVSATIAHQYLFTWLGQKVMQDLRVAVFSHLQRLPVSLYDQIPSGKLVTRVTNDISLLADMFTAGFVTVAGNVLVVIGILISLLLLNFELGLIAIAIFPVLLLFSIRFSRWLRLAYRESRSKLSALNAFLAENILGMRVVHLFNRRPLHESRFSRLNEWYSEAEIGTVRVYAYFQPMITWCTGISMALVIWYGGGMAHSGLIAPGLLTAYFAYIIAAFQPVRDIADNWNIFLSGMASAERIFSILSWKPEAYYTDETPFEEAKPIEGIRGHIRFENVWFAYKDENWVLKDFNLEIAPGSSIGIVGATGSGKTTLISLLMRFYDPQKGRVLLDGKDLREYPKRRLRATIGIVQQDVFLFSGSIEENVTLGRAAGSGLSGPAILDELAQIPAIGQTLKKELIERGNNLSMGERQALSFARARYGNPAVWILDEATANVDSDTEQALEKMLRHCAAGKTCLMIAHRLATVKEADLILVLHKGALVEKGNHQGLLKSNGLYAKLYRYQESVAVLTEHQAPKAPTSQAAEATVT